MVHLENSDTLDYIQKIDYIETSDLNDFNITAAKIIFKEIQKKQKENENGYVVIGLSGGKTPLDVYMKMTEINDIKIDVSKLIFFIIDERYKGDDNKFSNYNNIKFFFEKLGINEEKQLYRIDAKKNIVECVLDYNNKIKNLINTYKKIDIALLGMGNDHHIASLFPHVFLNIYMNNYQNNYIYKDEGFFNNSFDDSNNLDLLNEYVYFTTTNNFDVRKRITTSFKLLQKSSKIFFLFNNVEKLNVWKNMLIKYFTDKINYNMYPALYLLKKACHANVSVITYGQNNYSKEIETVYNMKNIITFNNETTNKKEYLMIIVFGCSGDLAHKKIYPALFRLYCNGLLSKDSLIIGFARTEQDFESFFSKLSIYLKNSLSCYYHLNDNEKKEVLNNFKNRCRYYIGNYIDSNSFEKFNSYLKEQEDFLLSSNQNNENKKKSYVINRILYLALPPHIFVSTLKNYKHYCLNKKGSEKVLLEKPFGTDLDSFIILSRNVLEHFNEESLYRIDHYLGKDMVSGLIKLKFTNAFLFSLMNRHYIKCIRITLKEKRGILGRGQYFDPYGIIRDVMQNHMLQLLALIAMEYPINSDYQSIQNEKIKILKSIPSIKLEDCIIGQYEKSNIHEQKIDEENVDKTKINHNYHDDLHVPSDSLTPTFCTCILYINSVNWYGVPIIFKAGKALNKDICEIKIQFHNIMNSSDNMFNNEFVIVLQPKEEIYLKILLKKPASDDMKEVKLNFQLNEEYKKVIVPEAYETLILQCMKGCKTKFISNVELFESWRIFTPLLNELKSKKIKPLKYPFGSSGPKEVIQFIQKYYNYYEKS